MSAFTERAAGLLDDAEPIPDEVLEEVAALIPESEARRLIDAFDEEHDGLWEAICADIGIPRTQSASCSKASPAR